MEKHYYCTAKDQPRGILVKAENRIEARKVAANRFKVEFYEIIVKEVRND